MNELVLPWALWLEQTSLAVAVRSSTWLYPGVEVVHLIGLGLLVGTAVAFDIRLLTAAAWLPVEALAAHLLPWARTGFALLVVSGGLLFAANASSYLTWLFLLKMSAIAVATSNATLFHRGVFLSVESWGHAPRTPMAARVAAVVSLCSWMTALVCGRLLAYV